MSSKRLTTDRALVVMPSLTSGGAERSLISFLHEALQYSASVDLLLFRPEGLFLEEVPTGVRVLNTPVEMSLLYGPSQDVRRRATRNPVLSAQILIAKAALRFMTYTRPNASSMANAQQVWAHYRRVLPQLANHYDVAIAYQQGHAINFLVDCVNADIKIGWMHSSYSGHGFDPEVDRPFFRKLGALFAASEEIADELRRTFPDRSIRIVVQPNLVSASRVRSLAQVEVPDLPTQARGCVMLSIGRLAHQKDYGLLLEAAAILRKRGHVYSLYIIGEGTERERLLSIIAQEGLQDCVTLLGVRPNPYPWLAYADLYVQTSQFEGDGLAIREARILGKPLVLTPFTTASRHVSNSFNGLVAERSPDGVADAIQEILNNLDFYRANALQAAENDLRNPDTGLGPFIAEIDRLQKQ